MWYLRIIDNKFGFVKKGIHEILETDISITEKEYEEYFNLQSSGHQFEVFDINQKTLFKILKSK